MPKLPKTIHPLHHVRGALKKSQSEFAKMFGVSESFVQAIELRKRKMTGDLVDSLALNLGIDPDTLEEGIPKSLIETRAIEFSFSIGSSTEETIVKEMDEIVGTEDDLERLGYCVDFWKKRVAKSWDWDAPFQGLMSKVQLLFQAAHREGKAFTLGMRLDRWIDSVVREFKLDVTLRAVLATDRALAVAELQKHGMPESLYAGFQPFIRLLSESFAAPTKRVNRAASPRRRS